MKYILRPYQKEAVGAGADYLMDRKMRGRNGVIVAPTGSGKSLVIASLAARLDGPCVIFQPNGEILQQNAAKLASYGFKPRIFSAGFGRRDVGRVTLATIGSVVRHPERFADVPYVIIDECHYVNAKAGMYRKFLEQMSGSRTLGLTATPYRLATNSFGSELRFLTRTRPRVFRDLVHYTQIPELFAQGYLAPIQYRSALAIDHRQLDVNSTGADYTDRSVRSHYKKTGFSVRLVGETEREMAAGRTPVIFTRFISESEALSRAIPGVEVVSSKTKKADRRLILEDFKARRVPAVANVGIIAIGFDYPRLDSIILARPTLSLALYYQQIGRAIRTHPEKDAAHVVDMVGLLDQFGPVENMTLRPGGKTGQKWAFYSGRYRLTNRFIEPRMAS